MAKLPDFSRPITASEALATRCLHTIINTRSVKGRDEVSCLSCGMVFDPALPAPRVLTRVDDLVPDFDMLMISPRAKREVEAALEDARHQPESPMPAARAGRMRKGVTKAALKKR